MDYDGGEKSGRRRRTRALMAGGFSYETATTTTTIGDRKDAISYFIVFKFIILEPVSTQYLAVITGRLHSCGGEENKSENRFA